MAMGRGGTGREEEVALERLEALVRALEEEARALGTLHLLEQFKRELPAPVGAGPPLGTGGGRPGAAGRTPSHRPSRRRTQR